MWKEDKRTKAQASRRAEEKEEKTESRESEKGQAKEEKKDEEGKKEKELLEAKRDEKTLASIWELLMNSKTHREALVLALDHKKIPTSYTPEQMICSLTENAPGAVVFTDDDLPLEKRDHHKDLFIKAEVKGKLTCYVMVDNGSAINVCSLKILPKLGLTEADLKPSKVVIKAYDDTKRLVVGIFLALIKIGPIEEWVNLHVIDIPVTFAILLGRPWFHSLGGVPSTLH